VGALALVLPLGVWADEPRDAATPGPATPADVIREVGFDQNLNTQLPLEAKFRDEAGRAVELREYFGKRPVVLALVYYDCPMLCTLILNGLTSSLKAVNLDAGIDFDVIAVSFDPRETAELALAKKTEYVKEYGRSGSERGWHFLTGDEESIRQLTQAVGFKYFWDEESKQFAHASGVMVVTPEGKLAKYFYGIEYAPRDVKLGLVEASAGRIGSPVDRMLLYCYHYDPATGKYSLAVLNLIRLLGLSTVAAIVLFIVVMLRRERRGAVPSSPAIG
jgi:protein SCO1/2